MNYELRIAGNCLFGAFLDGTNDSTQLIGIGIDTIEFCFR